MLDVQHRQTVNRGGLWAHPIVINHGGSLSGNESKHTLVEREKSGWFSPCLYSDYLLLTQAREN